MLDLKLTLGCKIFISYTIVSVITRNGKNEVIYSEGTGVCRVSDIVNLSVNKKPPMIYFTIEDLAIISYLQKKFHTLK